MDRAICEKEQEMKRQTIEEYVREMLNRKGK